MNNLMRMGVMGQQTSSGPPADSPQVDTAETIMISSLALLKMLKHGALLYVFYLFIFFRIAHLISRLNRFFLATKRPLTRN